MKDGDFGPIGPQSTSSQAAQTGQQASAQAAVLSTPLPGKNLTASQSCPATQDWYTWGQYKYAGNGRVFYVVKATGETRQDTLGGLAEAYASATEGMEASLLSWLRCHQNVERRQTASGAPADSSDLDTVTPQVQGCPKYFRKSLVEWRQVGNPQLNTWEIRNVSNKTLKVSFRESGETGSASSPDTLPPGNTTQIRLTNDRVPPYIVRDFSELLSFNKSAKSGQTLQCELAIRPR